MRSAPCLASAVATLFALLALIACRADTPAADAGADVDAELAAFEEAEDWFAARERLEHASELAPPARRYHGARVAHAFNDCERSDELARQALAGGELAPERALALRRLEYENALRRGRWQAAGVAAQRLLDDPPAPLPADLVRELENLTVLFGALADVPPMAVEVTTDGHVTPLANGRIPFRLEGHELAFALDTGANFSVIMRSVAQAAGLEIRPVGLRVGTSTGEPAYADLAVADELVLGTASFTNAVFLVFPDELLTIQGGPTIPGLLGFGLMEALGEVRLRADGSFSFPSVVPERDLRNLALVGLEPLIRFDALGSAWVARLDTGANRTVLYEPFARANAAMLAADATPAEAWTAGVGSKVVIDAWNLPALEIELGGQRTTLVEVDVYRDPLPRVDRGDLHANIGLDVVRRFDECVLNFRSMAFVLH